VSLLALYIRSHPPHFHFRLTVGVSALANSAMASTGTRNKDQPWSTPRQEGFIAPSQYKTSPGMSCVVLASSSSASL